MFSSPKRVPLYVVLFFSFVSLKSQSLIERLEPPTWWVGMKNPHLQLLVKGHDIGQTTKVFLEPDMGIRMIQIHHVDNPDYLFIDLDLSQASAGGTKLVFYKGNQKLGIGQFTLSERESTHDLIDSRDVIYLITPDRFANGDPENDTVEGLLDSLNRSDYNGRHGGDLAGIMDRLDYLQDLGVTTLWVNPLLLNAMPAVSYHGYAITDFYQMDPRFGTNEAYKDLSEALSQRGMKLMMDMVFNHCGSEHWWIKEMPCMDWIHDVEDYQVTNYAIGTVSDPHASDADRRLLERGWFVPSMPDLNHDNAFMETYLIQNSIWWIEFAGLEGIRMDTYPYNKRTTMQHWADRVQEEYPGFYLVGETWIADEMQEAYWAPGGLKGTEYVSGLTSITDFPLCEAMQAAFRKGGDIRILYEVLSRDFAYNDPSTNLVFADNHDMDRFFHTIGEDLPRFKNAMTFLMTTRGIPQVYYGTEILMKGYGEHGVLREDFPGGWSEDVRNAFTSDGRTDAENAAFEHMRHLLSWRKSNPAVSLGGLTHFIPENNVYVYCREYVQNKVVIFINNSDSDQLVNLSRYGEILAGYTYGHEVLSDQKVMLGDQLMMSSNSSLILELRRGH